MRILMISSFLPYPLFSGGQVRLYNLIKALSEKHEITLVCEKRSNQTQKDVLELEKICKKVVAVERRKQWSVGNLLKTAGSSHSFLITGHTNNNLKDKIKEELDTNNFDLIHVETFYVFQNLPETNLPTVLAEHNIEYQVYSRYVDQVSPVMRPILSLDISKIKKEEEAAWKNASKLVAVSLDDKKIMEEKDLHPFIVANGVDVGKFGFKKYLPSFAKASANDAKNVLFIGDFKWIQNIDAASFIIKEIWPELNLKLKSKNLKLKLRIVGRNIPESIKSLTEDKSIIFDEDNSKKPTEQLFQEADILLAPIRVGGGTSYKILEAMSCGTPVVTTPLSAGAIGARDGQELMVGRDAIELAKKILDLVTDYSLYQKISKNGRELVEKNYTWDKIARDLERVYESLL